MSKTMAWTCLAALLLAGCGNKGDLVLPDKPDAAKPAAKTAQAAPPHRDAAAPSRRP